MTQQVKSEGQYWATYGASTGYFTPVATPTDILGFKNTATSGVTLKLLRMTIDSTQTAAGINKWFLIYRVTADTGSTPVNVDMIPLAGTGPAATNGWVVQYTVANPTVGTPAGSLGSPTGIIKAASLLSPVATSVYTGEQVLWDDRYDGAPIILPAGGGNGVYLNFNGAAVPGGLSMCVNLIFARL